MSAFKGCLFSATQFFLIFGHGKYNSGHLEPNQSILLYYYDDYVLQVKEMNLNKSP